MIISFDLRSLFQSIGGYGVVGGGLIMNWGFPIGLGPTPPPSGSIVEYIYFCRHRHRR